MSIEHRKEERKSASGSVQIYKDGSDTPLAATLINASRHGFRIHLDSGTLTVGEQVWLRYPWGEVIARVAWQEAGEAGLFVP